MIKYKGVYPAVDDSIILTRCLIHPISNITQDTIKIPGRPGVLHVNRSHSERPIELSFELNAKTSKQNAALAAHLSDWAESTTPQQLIPDEQPDRYYLAQLESMSAPDLAEPFPVITVRFVCADPYAYSLAERSMSVGNPMVNDGNVHVRPVIRFTPSALHVGATWSLNGRSISILGYSIQPGHTIIIDCVNRVITDNGQADAIMQKLSLTSDWLELAPGSNDISGPGGVATWRDAWL